MDGAKYSFNISASFFMKIRALRSAKSMYIRKTPIFYTAIFQCNLIDVKVNTFPIRCFVTEWVPVIKAGWKKSCITSFQKVKIQLDLAACSVAFWWDWFLAKFFWGARSTCGRSVEYYGQKVLKVKWIFGNTCIYKFEGNTS